MMYNFLVCSVFLAAMLCSCRLPEANRLGPPVEAEEGYSIHIANGATPNLKPDEVLKIACDLVNSSEPSLRGAKCTDMLFTNDPNTPSGSVEWLLRFRWKPWSVDMEYLVAVNDQTRKAKIHR
jgi:hypothetical protein